MTNNNSHTNQNKEKRTDALFCRKKSIIHYEVLSPVRYVLATTTASSNPTNNNRTTSSPITTTTTTIHTTTTIPTSFTTALIAGGMAGMSVDIVLFPIDTIKTRLQSPVGLWKSGGFRGIYNGLGAVVVGSAPGAALFFSTYETMKPVVENNFRTEAAEQESSISHMIAASMGEAMACLVRVPTEVIKSKMQTATTKIGLWDTIKIILTERHGVHPMLSSLTGGLYRGYGITLLREIPFAMIQFPLYEKFKYYFSIYNKQKNDHSSSLSSPCTPFQAAISGSISGGIAAAITTPLDVIKTRLMIGQDKFHVPYQGVVDVVQKTIQHDGRMALWNGIQPRVFWITLGGFVFFGAYEEAKHLIERINKMKKTSI